MSPDTRKILLGLVSEYGDSLTRVDAERDLQKMIVQRAEDECSQPAAAFKRVAKAYQKDKSAELREESEAQIDLLDVLQLRDEAKAEAEAQGSETVRESRVYDFPVAA